MAVVHAVGDEGFSSLSSALDRLDPDFRRLLVEGAYAGLIARPNLALKHRELITVAVLATVGNADSALKYHAAGMLNTGWTPEELLETILHTLVYSGVSVAIAAMRIAFTVFNERGIETEHNKKRATHDGGPGKPHVAWLLEGQREIFDQFPQEIQKKLAELVCRIASSRPTLTLKDRELTTLAIAMARGNQLAAVRVHLKACMRLGWRRSELTEVLIQLTGYIGWPLILPVTRMALEVFEEAATDDVSDATGSHVAVDVPATTSLSAGVLSGFAVPKGVANLSPVVAGYLEAMGLSENGPPSGEQARAQRLTDIACLTCLARNADADVMAEHVKEALSLGASVQDITDAIVRTLPHAGALAVRYGLAVANQVFGSTTQTDIADRRIA
ncbi:carboxymuconolactone decarboxylase family protein [Paraburkholderia kururiensis]|uniref:carboxymuconolactone decarboxylase family protein n=1 Tax=Paraburkholderia kururiensis TaxID=984307 RepID=UPI00037B3EC8|nr:carboxymuconolactone decarboxylase family protein [Paraburkholderia kururiensis]